MSDGTSRFNGAELALASYFDLQGSATGTPVNIEALQGGAGVNGMSSIQAEEFAKRFPTIVTQFNDTPAEGGMGTSFRKWGQTP
jgi:hypothetical protein